MNIKVDHAALMANFAHNCGACGMRRSWGCGHTSEQELESFQHILSEKHYLGECSQCFNDAPGYFAPAPPRTLYQTYRDYLLSWNVIEQQVREVS